jgi:sugar-specific transcriptional regulator TrmB
MRIEIEATQEQIDRMKTLHDRSLELKKRRENYRLEMLKDMKIVRDRYRDVIKSVSKELARTSIDIDDLFDDLVKNDLDLMDKRVVWSQSEGKFLALSDEDDPSAPAKDILGMLGFHLAMEDDDEDDDFGEDEDDDLPA